MEISVIESNGKRIASAFSAAPEINSAQTALDLLATAHYETGAYSLIINKEALAEEFFSLGTGLAGEILQKFSNYRMRLAIVGDFSLYTSKALRDFMYESNKGGHVFFVRDMDGAVRMLGG